MRLIHYSNEKFELEERTYPLLEGYINKPSGLWVSVEGENDWKSWCIAQDFALDYLSHSYEVILNKNSNIIMINNHDELLEFTNKFSLNIYSTKEYYSIKKLFSCDFWNLNWIEVTKIYQGIIIAPYLGSCIYTCPWYYGWDCASGCIWDLSCIESFTYLGYEEIKRDSCAVND